MTKSLKMGFGIKRMKDAIKNAGLKPPKFELGSFFRAIFYRPVETQVAEKVTNGVTKKVTIKVTDHSAKMNKGVI